MMNRWWPWWNRLVGAMDASTGLLLVVAPDFTLRLMLVPPPAPPAMIFLSWIGAFVAAVGLSYFVAPSRADTPEERERLATVWRVTSIARVCVATFLAVTIARGQLPAQWLLVALADGVIASVQTRWLWSGFPMPR